ncbi:MAG: ImmA/IrrE family metallo-endopeptidase [Actinobacteria bacterium]|nr:ImmA/IrrE family metallo-endopeptidase [Actinomycetota bacterium]MCL5986916.1 ImmA/IrrE family metallo-endopeptidase [Actinomycetota bacterium]
MVFPDIGQKELQTRTYAQQLRADLGVLDSYAPIGMLAQARGISRIIEIPLQSDGFLAQENNELVIYVNSQIGAARRRFTCAHEIGHTYLANRMISNFNVSMENKNRSGCYIEFTQQDKEEEYLCNIFAAELLMPRELVHTLLQQYGISVQCVQRISSAFGVSLSAASWRLSELANKDVGIIWFKRMGKLDNPADVKMRIDWGVFPNQKRVHLPRYDSVKKDSLIEKAFLSRQTEEGIENLDLGNIHGDRFIHCKRFHNSVLCLVFQET